jgi:hypothetical protein
VKCYLNRLRFIYTPLANMPRKSDSRNVLRNSCQPVGQVRFSYRACRREGEKEQGEGEGEFLMKRRSGTKGWGGALSSGHLQGGLAGIGAPHEGKSPARTAPSDIGPGPGTFANNMYVQQPGMW